jgi:hypothetical protein
VEQSAQEVGRELLDDLALPVGHLQGAFVLAPGTVLGEEAGPVRFQ